MWMLNGDHVAVYSLSYLPINPSPPRPPFSKSYPFFYHQPDMGIHKTCFYMRPKLHDVNDLLDVNKTSVIQIQLYGTYGTRVNKAKSQQTTSGGPSKMASGECQLKVLSADMSYFGFVDNMILYQRRY